MNVLWIVNAPLPEALSILQGSKVESHSTGSWECALLELFCARTDIDLSAEDFMSTTAQWLLQIRYAFHLTNLHSMTVLKKCRLPLPDITS